MAKAANKVATSPQLALTDPDIPLHQQVRHRGLLTLAIMGASIMQILDTTIANVAIPHMQSSLGATSETVNWILTSYIVATAVAMPITGWLADQIGKRQLFLLSIVAFIISSMLCGAAQNLEQMVAFRFLQGISAAFIGPLTQSVMLDINAPERHARAMSIWGMGIMIGPILGPLLGGWITEISSWRWVFYVNLPFGLIVLVMMWLWLPNMPLARRRFDLFGFAMIGIGLAALQLMLDRGAHKDWFASPEIWIEMLVALSCLWIFIVHLMTSRNTLFDRSLFADRNMLTALGFMLVIGLAMFASMALLPPMLQNLFGWPVIDTGLGLSARGVGILFSMGLAARLLPILDPRILVATGFFIAALSMAMMSQWSLDIGMWHVVSSGLVQGLGMGLVFIPLNSMAFATIPAHFRTDASSLLNLMRSLGGSLGISILVTLLASNSQRSHEELGRYISASGNGLIDAESLGRFGEMGTAAIAMVNAEISRQAAMLAYINDFYVMMWAMLAVIPLALLLRPAKASDGSGNISASRADMGH